MEKFFPLNSLQHFTKSVFEHIGCPEDHALTATNALLSADLRGIDSHGIARLVGYVRLWESGRVNAKPEIRIIHESPSTATVDGDSGLGLVVAPFAMQVAIQKASQAGTGWVAVQNSNHFGIAAYHAMKALEHGMIGIAMTNASALVAPTFSLERMLGTNPICVAIPSGLPTDVPPNFMIFITEFLLLIKAAKLGTFTSRFEIQESRFAIYQLVFGDLPLPKAIAVFLFRGVLLPSIFPDHPE